MSLNIPPVVFYICFGMLAMSFVLTSYRVFKGPTSADRAISADLLGMVTMGTILIFSMFMNTSVYLPAALVISIVGFTSLVIVGKFLFGGDLIDRDNH